MQIQGVVVRGKGEARALGYPTANLEYTSDKSPETGIWVCRAMVEGEEVFGLAVIGMWQLENGLPSIEIYILDFDHDIFGQTLTVTLQKKIRNLQKFYDVKSLIQQIEKDVEEARKLL